VRSVNGLPWTVVNVSGTSRRIGRPSTRSNRPALEAERFADPQPGVSPEPDEGAVAVWDDIEQARPYLDDLIFFLSGPGELSDAATARSFLSAADEAATRLGKDANHLWTAFGPTRRRAGCLTRR
jgi:hypothetical protein